MTKSELIDQVADSAGLTSQDAGRAVDAVLATSRMRCVAAARCVVGVRQVPRRRSRRTEGVNPRTGERIQIPASQVPRFTAGSGLKSAVKGALSSEDTSPARGPEPATQTVR